MSLRMKKGTFIVIDGTDASGKKTQTALLVERLKKSGREAQSIDFPRYKKNLVADQIRDGLDGKIPHFDFLALPAKIASILYAADRAESKEEIEKWLSEGQYVVADRYVSSNQIHQGGKIRDEHERESFLTWLDDLEFTRLKLPRPDLIVYLHVPVELSIELARTRAEKNGESPDAAEVSVRHQRESQESALHVVKRSNNCVRIDCAPKGVMLPAPEIHELIWKLIK